MASSAPTTTHTQSQNTGDNNYGFALTSLTTLFFMWGFITCLNDILIPHLKAVFDLTYVQAMLVQFCFFGAYFLMSIPSGLIVKKLGYKNGIVVGLLIAAVGCVLFYPAAQMHNYPVFLFALFVLASGITLLQVSANPYVSLLGPAKTASSRLTLTQAFNALGTTVAPSFGALLILGSASDAFLTPAQNAESVQLPYLLLAAMLIVLAGVFAWQYRHLVLGAVGIFMYVGAEVAIGSFLVSFLAQENIAGLKEHVAAHYITYYFGGAMVGRFIGAAVMQKLPAGKVLGFNATMAIILVVIAMSTSGQLAMWSILLVGLFNSIMFPTIFSLALNGLGKHTAQGSGILCLAIVGGAIVPLLQGALADSVGVQLSYALPILCYLFIVFYGLSGSKPVQAKETL